MDTLNSTFALLAGEFAKECIDCGGTNDLTVLCTTESGPMWICPDCRAESDCEAQERCDSAMDEIATWAAIDEWEEG